VLRDTVIRRGGRGCSCITWTHRNYSFTLIDAIVRADNARLIVEVIHKSARPLHVARIFLINAKRHSDETDDYLRSRVDRTLSHQPVQLRRRSWNRLIFVVLITYYVIDDSMYSRQRERERERENTRVSFNRAIVFLSVSDTL